MSLPLFFLVTPTFLTPLSQLLTPTFLTPLSQLLPLLCPNPSLKSFQLLSTPSYLLISFLTLSQTFPTFFHLISFLTFSQTFVSNPHPLFFLNLTRAPHLPDTPFPTPSLAMPQPISQTFLTPSYLPISSFPS